jgi:serine/threonine protein kinase
LKPAAELQCNDADQQAPLTDTLLTTATGWVQAREEALDSKLQGLLILPEDVTRGSLIGKGGYGSVFKGTLKGSQAVAIKSIELAGALMKRDQMDIKREAYIHKQAHDHPNICKLLGVMLPSLGTQSTPQQPNTEFAIVMELLQGDLGQYLRAEDELLSLEERLQLALDVAEGMAHLHSKNIVHGDLKPGNLLIRKLEGEGQQVQVAVSDFGLSSISCVTLCSATMAAQATQSSSTGLSLWYSPPELLDNCSSKKTPAGDVYAFGIILFEILTGQLPYSVSQYDVVLKNVLEGTRPAVPDGAQLPQGCQELMASCWDADPAARPSFAEAKHEICALLAACCTRVE